MKKFVALLFFTLCASIATFAGMFEVNGVQYSFSSSNSSTVSVYKYTSELPKDVIIPAEVSYNGRTYSVTSIGYYAFKGCTSLASIELPNSVTSIRSDAFKGCTSLSKVVIADGSGALSIDNSSFTGCPLQEVYLGRNLSYTGDSPFRSQEKLSKVTIGSSVTTIKGAAFSGCTSLTSIELPNSVTSIGESAFEGCTRLSSIELPNSVTKIGSDAFSGCTSLSKVVMSDGSETLSIDGSSSLFADSPLQEVYLGRNLSYEFCYSPFRSQKELTKVTIGNSVTRIGEDAFSYCTSLSSFELPNSVTSIGKSALNGCTSLSSINLPNSVTWIGESAFRGCTSLSSIELPNSVTSIGESAFEGCTSLSKVVISDGSETLSVGSRSALFAGCPLQEVYLGRDLSYKDDYSPFRSQKKLYKVTIGNSVTSIGWSAFSGCTSLSSIDLPNSVTWIGGSAFSGCTSLSSIELPNSVTRIGGSAFCGCTSLASIVVPNNVTSIGYSAFEGCTSLSSIKLSNSVTSIEYSAFEGCTSLSSIELPNSVTSIGKSAFSGCTSLANVVMSDGSETLSIDGSSALFIDCPLQEVYLGRNLYYGFGYSPFCSQKKLYKVTIGNSVTWIGAVAFSGCTSLSSIELPNSVTSIGESAFSGCTSLTNVVMSDGSKTLSIGGSSSLFAHSPLQEVYLGRNLSYNYGYSPFSSQEKLSKVTIGNSVTRIEETAFRGCTSLSSVELPNSVTRIEESAFRGCTRLSSIELPNSVTSIGESAFSGCTSLSQVVISDGSETLSIDGSSSLFAGCPLQEVYLGRNLYYKSGYFPFRSQTKLSKVTIGNSVTRIEESAFRGCIRLSSIELPNSVTRIGESAFRGCTSLSSIELPNSVTKIGSNAFSGCTSLSKVVMSDGSETLSIDGSSSLFTDSPLQEVYLGRNLSYESFYNDYYSPFRSQKKLSKVTIGNSVTSIGASAFAGCGIKEIFIYDNVSIDNSSFDPQTRGAAKVIVRGDRDLALAFSESQWGRFSCMVYEEDSKQYFLISWNAQLNCPEAFYSTENRCLVSAESDEVVVHENTETILTAFFRGREITELLAQKDGFAFKPSENWHQNEFLVFTDGNVGTARNVTVASAGQLFNELGMENIQTIEMLTITGDLNGTDIMTINRMQSLKYLDLSEANIVEGGVTYHENLKTQNDVFGDYFFRNLETLSVVIVPKTLKEIGSYVVNKSIKQIIIPNGVTSIGGSAFYGCSSLASIELPNSVTSIGGSAFYGCTSLASIEIPNSVTWIGSAFSGCTSLANVVISDGSETLSIGGRSALFADSPLQEVYLGRNLSYESYYSPFRSQEKLSKVTIGNSVTSIGASAFHGCTSLSSINLPNSVTEIGLSAFSVCTSLSSIVVPNSVTKIKMATFSGCTSLSSIELPNRLTEIGKSVFEGCTSLSVIELPNSVTSIGESAFSGCTSLASIELPNNVTSIGDSAFSGCTSLSSIELPNSVPSIGASAFSGCTSLAKVVIADGRETLSIGGYAALFADSPLQEVYLGRNLSYKDDYPPFRSQTKLYKVTIGNNVTWIGRYTFEGCTSLRSILIPNSVTSIGWGAFRGCTSLASIELPNSVTEIGWSAFYGCSSLSSIELPSSVTRIGDSAFYGCSSLSSIELPSSVTSIGGGAFYGCPALMKIISLNPTPPAIQASTFNGVDKANCQLLVTKGNLVYYWLDPYWKEFLQISDDLLALNPLPMVKYGDAGVNLAEYAPAGVMLSYESSNNNVARIDGTMLTICGAGEATVSASVPDAGTPMEIIGQMRTFIVSKADLTLTAQTYEIVQGEPMPDFAITYNGFVYDDNADSLQELPAITCDAIDTSKEGEYAISLSGGYDSNYNMKLVNGRLIIRRPSAIPSIEHDEDAFSCFVEDGQIHIRGLAESQGVEIYDTNGLLCCRRDNLGDEELIYRPHKLGVYIVRAGNNIVKVAVR